MESRPTTRCTGRAASGAPVNADVRCTVTTFDAFTAIYSALLSPQAIPYALAALALTAFAWFWRRSFHSSKQRLAIHLALSLWLLGPVAALIGAVFRFNGPAASRGVAFNELASNAVGALLIISVVLGIGLILFAKGARINVAAAIVPVLFVQFWVSFVSGCAMVGACT